MDLKVEMKSKILVPILIFILNTSGSFGQNEVLSCNYKIDSFYGYTCELTIQNPNGLNNFLIIVGKHLDGKTNDDVRNVISIYGSNTTNVPSIICKLFGNVPISVKSILLKGFSSGREVKVFVLCRQGCGKMEPKLQTT